VIRPLRQWHGRLWWLLALALPALLVAALAVRPELPAEPAPLPGAPFEPSATR
jgi:hypothetical protein